MRLTLLGCGPSGGVPGVGYGWGACDPSEPRNRRLRPSALIESGGKTILIDTAPDLREQLLAAEVRRLDALLLTHAHADHLHGIDDLRPINRLMDAPIDLYGDAATLAAVRERFGYVLEPLAPGATLYYKPVLIPHEIGDGDAFEVADIPIRAFVQDHGYGETLGFVFGGRIAYTTDLYKLPEHAFDILAGVEVWVVGVLDSKPQPTHADVDLAVGWAKRVGPKLMIMTHLGPNLDYRTLAARLPKGIVPGHDRMTVETDGDTIVVDGVRV